MSPQEKAGIDPVLRIGDRSWDLTNLFPQGKIPQHHLENAHQTNRQRKNRSRCRPRRATKVEPSLYPDLNQLDESTFHLEPASEVFRRVTVRSPSPTPTSQPGAFQATPDGPSGFTRSPQRPGAFASSNSASRPKPPLPSWVDSPDNLQRKIKATESNSTHKPSSQYLQRQTSRPQVDIYRQESIQSFQSSGSSLSTNPISRTDEEDEYAATGTVPRRSRIEVSPGYYLPLRGSVETLAAVDGGMARKVQCMACSATLLCVPDAELVICPDCRLLSPLTTSKQQYGSTQQQPGVQYTVGGVGLGLKVEDNGSY